jgi:hypothetical protein
MKFDCGKAERQAAPGFTALSGQDTYTAARGYGWLAAWGIDWHGDGPKTTVHGSATGARDPVAIRPEENDVTFRADIPDGVYKVTIWAGIESPREGRLGICLAINGRAVLPSPGVGGWGIVAERTLPAVVEHGQLLLNFYVIGEGGAARLSLLGFAAEAVADPAEQESIRRKWLACGPKEAAPRKATFGGRTYTEVGRRNEEPLAALPDERRQTPLLFFTRPNPGDLLDYSIPRAGELCRQLAAFASPGEDQPVWFAVHARRAFNNVRIACTDLAGQAGRIDAGQVEVFTLRTRPRSMTDYRGTLFTLAADLLDPTNRFDVAAGRTQAVYLRIRVPPGAAAGFYTGQVTLVAADLPPERVPLTLRVLPLQLAQPPKSWHIFADPQRWVGMSQTAWQAEIDDMARHGIDSLSISYPPYGASYIEKDGRIVDADFGRTGEVLQYAKRAGMTGPVLISATPGIFWRFRGWSIGHTGNGTHAFVDGREGRALALRHTNSQARSAAHQITGALLAPDEPVRLSVRYRTEGAGAATFSLIFMETHKRGEVTNGSVRATLPPAADWQTFEATTRVPRLAPYARADLAFAGGSGALIVDHVSLICGGETRNAVINPGFERDIDLPAETAAEWPASFMSEYVDAIRALGRAVERAGLTPWIEGTDEASGSPRERNEMRGARLSGLPTFCNLSPAAVDAMGDTLDKVCLYSSFLGTESNCGDLLERMHGRGQQLFFIASGAYVGQEFDLLPNRHHVGLCFWKSGADGTGIWTFQRPSGDPFDDLDTGVKDYCLVFPPAAPGGMPIPTLGWEGVREGWRDFRYVHTLEQAVGKAEKEGRAAAAGVGREVLAFIHDATPWFSQSSDLGYDSAAADRLRWLAAWSTLELGRTKPFDAPPAGPAGAHAIRVAFTTPAATPERPPLPCPVANGIPLIDGRLDEPFWRTAARIDGLRNNATGAPAGQPSDVLFCHDTTNLYIGVRCTEPAMDQLLVAARTHDGAIFADDSIELFLDTSNDETHYLQLAFNAAGTRFDQRCRRDDVAQANVFGAKYEQAKSRDSDWNGEWFVKTSRQTNSWEAEIIIPFKTVGRASDLWGLNVCRNRKAGAVETSAWRPSRSFHQPDAFGKLLLTGARTGSTVLSQFEPPPPRSGAATAVLTLLNARAPSGHVEMRQHDGQTRRQDGTIADGALHLPCPLDAATEEVTFTLEENGAVTHRLHMPVEVPPPVTLIRGQKILYPDRPEGTVQLAIRLSAQEQLMRRFEASLLGPAGERIDQFVGAITGEVCTVSLDLAQRAPGLYGLALTLAAPNDAPAIHHREGIVLVPSFLEGRE